MVGAREDGEGAFTTDGLLDDEDLVEATLDSDLVLFLGEDIFLTLIFPYKLFSEMKGNESLDVSLPASAQKHK